MLYRFRPFACLSSSALVLVAVLLTSASPHAQVVAVGAQQPISSTEGGLEGPLADYDRFGRAVTSLGDHDGDGIVDVAVGAYHDSEVGDLTGAVYILFLNADGTVREEQKISAVAGGLVGPLEDLDYFGSSVASLGDLDGDGVGDLAVGAAGDGDGAFLAGAVYILFLNPDGTVRAEQKISPTEGGFTGPLIAWDFFGASVVSIGDHDGDGIGDIAVGAEEQEGGSGSVYVLLLNADGTVRGEQAISWDTGGLDAGLEDLDFFGSSVASVGDLDGDGVADLAVGAPGDDDDDGGDEWGAVYILFLNADGTVRAEQKISATEGGSEGPQSGERYFGASLTSTGDLNGDGMRDLVVGARGAGSPWGAGPWGSEVYVLTLDSDGTVHARHKLVDVEEGGARAEKGSAASGFGWPRPRGSLAVLGDLDGNGVDDLAVGAPNVDDGGLFRGAVYMLFLEVTVGPEVTFLSDTRDPIARGSFYRTRFTVTNPTAAPVRGGVFVEYAVPGGGTVTRRIENHVLQPGETYTVRTKEPVPTHAPSGVYTVRMSFESVDRSTVYDAATADFTILSLDDLSTSASGVRGALAPEAGPNPFRESTAIGYTLAEDAEVDLRVFDARGREVAVLASGVQPKGDHRAVFEAEGLPGGIYVWRLSHGGTVTTGQIVAVR